MASLFNTLITNINGVGDRRAVLFNKLGVTTVGDLLYFFPRAYNFWNTPKEIALLQDGETCCIKAKICSAFSENYIKGTSQRFVSKTAASDASGVIELTFFNNKYIKNMLKYDEEYLFFGKVTRKLYGCEMLSPEFALPNNRNVIVPLYPGTAGLSNKQIIAAVKTALAMLPDTMQDTLPDIIREQYGLIGLKEALQQIHFPKKVGDELQARKRLAFEELLVLNLGLRQIKKAGATAPGIKISNDYTNEFIKMLPFKLTNAQQRVIAECCNDMQHKPCAMNRLIQGDVGSGKTAVAAAMCYNVVKNGFQAAFMAPTEVLAIQHFNSLKQLLEPVGITVAILTGSMPKKVKDSVRTGLHSGEIDIIIGTHALLTEDTEFANLALVITDEQHRFGVKQRAALTQKGQNPHLLVMSATPIPRTLGLIIFGELDISIIDEMPPGRTPVKTVLIGADKHARAYNFIKENINKGQQCFVVCPLVNEGAIEAQAAESYAAELMLQEFADIPVGVLHGKMKPKQKAEVMEQFAKNELSILVATTVIEVGIDVPNATIMLIENAERFGLSQLHQLRGRVGRGSKKSWCILVSDSQNENTLQRLAAMCKTNDGFKIADEDLKQRGPGDFFGNKQHGLPQLKIAEFSDSATVELSSQAANEIIEHSPDLSAPELKYLLGSIKRLFPKGNLTL